MNAKDIALFLYKGEGLNKTAIGKIKVTVYSNKYLKLFEINQLQATI